MKNGTKSRVMASLSENMTKQGLCQPLRKAYRAATRCKRVVKKPGGRLLLGGGGGGKGKCNASSAKVTSRFAVAIKLSAMLALALSKSCATTPRDVSGTRSGLKDRGHARSQSDLENNGMLQAGAQQNISTRFHFP